MLYVAAYTVIALVAFSLRDDRKSRDIFYSIFFLTLFLFCAFRFEVGCDWSGYLNQYNIAKTPSIRDANSLTENPLWWQLVVFIKELGFSYPWLNVLANIIFFTGLHQLGKHQPDRLAFLAFTFPILLVNIAMSGIRQAAAVGILCFAFVAFVENRTVRFAVLVVISSLIHSSALVFLLLTPLVNGSYSRSRLVFAGFLAIPGMMLLMKSAGAEVAMDRYVESYNDAAGAVFRVGLLGLTGAVFLLVLRRPWLHTQTADYKLVTVASYAMIILVAVLPLSTVIADRFGYYLVPIQAIIFARISFLPIGRLRSNYALTAFVALGLTLAVWVSLSSHFHDCYVPYQSWLFGMPKNLYGF